MNMDRIFISLRADFSNDAPAGAGWYVQAVADGETVIAPMGISIETAQELAGAFQKALQSSDEELPQISVVHLVNNASKFIHQALEHQLRYAEEQAAKISTLRRKLSLAPPLLKDNVKP